jgi:hypothetical protein
LGWADPDFWVSPIGSARTDLWGQPQADLLNQPQARLQVDVELSEYKKMARLPMGEVDKDGVEEAYTNPLLWWKSKCNQFPTIPVPGKTCVQIVKKLITQ